MIYKDGNNNYRFPQRVLLKGLIQLQKQPLIKDIHLSQEVQVNPHFLQLAFLLLGMLP